MSYDLPRRRRRRRRGRRQQEGKKQANEPREHRSRHLGSGGGGGGQVISFKLNTLPFTTESLVADIRMHDIAIYKQGRPPTNELLCTFSPYVCGRTKTSSIKRYFSPFVSFALPQLILARFHSSISFLSPLSHTHTHKEEEETRTSSFVVQAHKSTFKIQHTYSKILDVRTFSATLSLNLHQILLRCVVFLAATHSIQQVQNFLLLPSDQMLCW